MPPRGEDAMLLATPPAIVFETDSAQSEETNHCNNDNNNTLSLLDDFQQYPVTFEDKSELLFDRDRLALFSSMVNKRIWEVTNQLQAIRNIGHQQDEKQNEAFHRVFKNIEFEFQQAFILHNNKCVDKSQLFAFPLLFQSLQYIDAIEAMMNVTNHSLSSSSLLSLTSTTSSSSFSSKSPQLLFPISVGDAVLQSVKAENNDDIKAKVKVEPIVELSAQDLENGRSLNSEQYSLSVEECSYNPILGASFEGQTGEVLIKVKVSPTAVEKEQKEEQKSKKGTAVWGIHKDVKKIPIKIARSVQLNAANPKSMDNVNMLYKSTMYGSRDVTLTMLIKTYPTLSANHNDDNKETVSCPQLHIDVVLVP